MTVKELINELEKVEDKTLPVLLYDGKIENGVEVDVRPSEALLW